MGCWRLMSLSPFFFANSSRISLSVPNIQTPETMSSAFLTVALPYRRRTRPRHTTVCLRDPPLRSASKSVPAQTSKAFSEWLTSNGMYLSELATWGRPKHPLAIAENTTDDGENSGRGLIAVKGIVQGEPLFEVPYELILTKDTALKALPLPEDVNEYIALACLLISEREKGDDSFWKPYLDILPLDEEIIPLFRWSEDELALLEGSPVLAETESLRMKLNNEYAMSSELYFEGNRDVFPTEVFTYEAWEWAFAILFSRAIRLSAVDYIALVPYADLLNHNPFVSTFIDLQYRPLANEKYVCLYTDRPYAIMDQVFVTYGPKSNAELLLLYGFVVDRNPYDSVDLVVSVSELDPLYEKKKKYLAESGVGEETMFPLYRDRYPMELIEYLRFCVSDENEFENADFGDFVSDTNETLVANAIIDACNAALKRYPQTREEDDKLIADYGMFQMLGTKQRWAIRQRRAEKRILERTIANIEAEMTDPTFMFTEIVKK